MSDTSLLYNENTCLILFFFTMKIYVWHCTSLQWKYMSDTVLLYNKNICLTLYFSTMKIHVLYCTSLQWKWISDTVLLYNENEYQILYYFPIKKYWYFKNINVGIWSFQKIYMDQILNLSDNKADINNKSTYVGNMFFNNIFSFLLLIRFKYS